MRRLLIPLLLALLSACPRPADDDDKDVGTSSSGGAPDGGGGSPDAGSPPDAGTTVSSAGRFDMGSPVLTELFVSPTGDDGASGTELGTPLRTLEAAWALVPNVLTTTGYAINLLPGSYPCGEDEMTSCLNRLADKRGSPAFPLILRSVDAAGRPALGTATLRGGLDLAELHSFYLLGVRLEAGGTDRPTNTSGNDVLHLAASDHVLIRQVTAVGPPGRTDSDSNIQEVFKANQVDHLYLEDCDFSGTFQTVVDYFSVQHGTVLGNNFHGAGGRCAYFKGGSAYLVVAENEMSDCSEAGFQSGEGSNLNLMALPWVHYEAYDFKVFNNVIHDVKGPGLSVSGGYNILMAYNTVYRTGLPNGDRTYGQVQLMLGGRSCVIVDEHPSAALASAACQALLDQGAWGTALAGNIFETGGNWVPNTNVFIYNNVFYNPAGAAAATMVTVDGPLTLPADARNLPDPARTDVNLVIKGNLFFNGGDTTLYGSGGGGDVGCEDVHPTCAASRVTADNAMGTVEPALADPVHGDFHPAPGGNVESAVAVAIPPFTWDTWPAGSQVPAGTLSNVVDTNRAGQARGSAPHPGAY